MKKLIFTFVLIMLAAASYAQRGITTPVKLSFFGNNGPTDSIPGNVLTVMGLDIGLLGTTTPYVYGLQASIINSISDDLKGVQLAALGAAGKTTGIVLSPTVRGKAFGLAASAISVNETTGLEIAALKYSDFYNMGVLINGISYTDGFGGLQIGLLNINKGMVVGVQIGLINYARQLHGVQIGLINVAYNGYVLALPICNFRF
ncbi:hypothetical protein AAIR98_000180 [Elusimicrobium simillimum]|uniref:LA_2272 family surface repeat-containing protein n=1 Tax=Elusimicrobium simillimum TaxID=3143438 RepID=UPI003C6F193E